MDNDEKRPNAALINREWFEAAAKALQRDDLCDILFSTVTYVIYGDMPEGLSSSAEIVFTMIRPALDSDIAKYTERCERNQRNATAGRQRVAASGSESQRVATNTTTTSTSTSTSISTSTPSLSPMETDERDRWTIFGYFWYSGSKAIKQELDAFWNYYDALGWKNNKGAPIVKRLSCARQWNRQFETGQAPDGAEAWFHAVKSCTIYDYSIWKAYAGAEREGDKVIVRLRCSSKYLTELQAAVPNLERSLQTMWKASNIEFQPAG